MNRPADERTVRWLPGTAVGPYPRGLPGASDVVMGACYRVPSTGTYWWRCLRQGACASWDTCPWSKCRIPNQWPASCSVGIATRDARSPG